MKVNQSVLEGYENYNVDNNKFLILCQFNWILLQ